MPSAVVVGAGLAGLSCARTLRAAGWDVRILERSSRIGGRVGSEVVDGFTCDRGFQVLLTAYPEARRQFDLPRLRLHAFAPGAVVWDGFRRHIVADPLRTPWRLVSTLLAQVGTTADKLRILDLRQRAAGSRFVDVESSRPERAPLALRRPRFRDLRADDYLRVVGFSEAIIDRFFRPFFGGAMLDPELGTSAHWLLYLYKMFTSGHAGIPARGMQALPDQLAAALPPDAVRTECEVVEMSARHVRLSDGAAMEADKVICAVDPWRTSTLLGAASPGVVETRGVTTLWYRARRTPLREPYLVLNGSGRGRFMHLGNLAVVAGTYAPRGEDLLQVTLPGTPPSPDLGDEVLEEVAPLLGASARTCRLLRIDRIPYGLPQRRPGEPWSAPAGEIPICGDWTASPSIQGALLSGRRAAEAVVGR